RGGGGEGRDEGGGDEGSGVARVGVGWWSMVARVGWQGRRGGGDGRGGVMRARTEIYLLGWFDEAIGFFESTLVTGLCACAQLGTGVRISSYIMNHQVSLDVRVVNGLVLDNLFPLAVVPVPLLMTSSLSSPDDDDFEISTTLVVLWG
nr:hypothetical protein [Tanacetum cinerariifolium]